MPNPLTPSSPIDYNSNTFRRAQRDMFGKIISLRTKYPAYQSTFTTNDLDYSLSGGFKWQRIRGSNLKLVVMGNFDVQSQTGIVQFPSSGTWYVYAHNLQAFESFSNVNAGLSSSSITIAPGAETQQFVLPAGAFILFTDKDVTAVVTQFTFTAPVAGVTRPTGRAATFRRRFYRLVPPSPSTQHQMARVCWM